MARLGIGRLEGGHLERAGPVGPPEPQQQPGVDGSRGQTQPRRAAEGIDRPPVADGQEQCHDGVIEQREIDLEAKGAQPEVAHRAAGAAARQQPQRRPKGQRSQRAGDGDDPVLDGGETALGHDVAPEDAVAELDDLATEQPDGHGMHELMHQDRGRHANVEGGLLGLLLLGPGQWLLPPLGPVADDLDAELKGAADVQQGKKVEQNGNDRHQQTSVMIIAHRGPSGKLATGRSSIGRRSC